MERERHIIGYLQKESKKMVEDFQSKQEPIDFGAFDSELQGWEYTIPEGYSAEIKDGKVIVKKAENEDERIRQAILRYFNAELLASEEERDKEILKKWIACLEKQKEDKKTYFDGYLKGYNEGQLNPIEKQKEHKPIEFKNDELVEIIKGEFEGFRNLLKKKGIDYEPQRVYWEGFARLFDSSAREYVKEQKPAHTAKEMWKEMRLEVYAQASGNRHEPNYSDDSTKMFSLCDIDEIFEKIGNSTVEQKPAEKQDYSGLTDFERAIHRGFLCAGVENVPVTIIKETAQDCMSRIKPAEWSDKDKNIFNLVLDLIKHSDDCSGLLDKELAVKWFAELPSRFVPQPKQELDEESKKVILNAVAFLNIYGNFLHNEGLEKESNAVYKVADSLKLLSIQPKQEWREEDEDVIRTIEIALGTSKTVSHDNYLRVMDWLRTLRPKPHLKLSEEQICTLERICSNLHLRASDDAPKLDEIIKLLKLK